MPRGGPYGPPLARFRAGDTAEVRHPIAIALVILALIAGCGGGGSSSEDRDLAIDEAAVAYAKGESTRPGAEAVGADAERDRVEPVIAALAGSGGPGVPISVDTSKAAVASAALDAGAAIVNDVTAFRGDAEMASLCADRRCEVVL